jgi:hypothetical protein
MARRHQILGALGRIDRRRDGPCPVGRRDAGRHALARLDRYGEGGPQARGVLLRHQRQLQLLDALLGEREANEAARVLRHEIDDLWGRHLRRDDEITLVLAVFVVDEDDHPAVARFLDHFLDRRDDLDEAHGSTSVLTLPVSLTRQCAAQRPRLTTALASPPASATGTAHPPLLSFPPCISRAT